MRQLPFIFFIPSCSESTLLQSLTQTGHIRTIFGYPPIQREKPAIKGHYDSPRKDRYQYSKPGTYELRLEIRPDKHDKGCEKRQKRIKEKLFSNPLSLEICN